MNVRVLIVDDEPLARRGVSLRLAEHPDITVIGECANGEDAIHARDFARGEYHWRGIAIPPRRRAENDFRNSGDPRWNSRHQYTAGVSRASTR